MRNPRPIKDALLKYGHNNFTLEILEYCSKAKLIEKEQYYFPARAARAGEITRLCRRGFRFISSWI